MQINQYGDYIELECCGCGEPMLVGEGDSVNVRVGTATDIDGEEIPMPDGFLCTVCHKEQGSQDKHLVRLERKRCCACGKLSETETDSYPKFDGDGNFNGFFCTDCF